MVKISELTTATTMADADLFEIETASGTSSNKITKENMLKEVVQSVYDGTGIGDEAITPQKTTFSDYGAETLIGEFMGQPLYRKVIDFGALPASAGDKTVPHGIVGLDKVLRLDGSTRNTSSGTIFPVPNGVANTNANISALISSSSTDMVSVQVGQNRSDYNQTFIVMEYTKS